MADNTMIVLESTQAALEQIINGHATEVDPEYDVNVKVGRETEGIIRSYRVRAIYKEVSPLDEVGRAMRKAYRDVLRTDRDVGEKFRDMRTFTLTGGSMPTNTFFFEDARRTRTSNMDPEDYRDEHTRKIELRGPSEAAVMELAKKMVEVIEQYKTEGGSAIQ